MSFMNRLFLSTLFLLITTSAVCFAGTLEGKVSSGDSVVYIDAIPGKTFPAPTQSVVLSQRGLKFVPRILIVQQGTTVEFQNDDSVQHNIFWPSVGGNKKAAHNMGTWARGEKRPYKFESAGVVPLYCNVHQQMSGFIVVSLRLISCKPIRGEISRSRTFPTANTPWWLGMRMRSPRVRQSRLREAAR